MPPISTALPAHGLLTERLLNDAGGWQVMKQARALHEMGRVSDAKWEAPLLEGRVREGETDFRSGLKIVTKTNVENLCGCQQSRRYAAICAHSIAVGLAILKPHPGTPLKPAAPEPVAAGPRFSTTAGTPLEIAVILPPNFGAAWDKGQLTVALEATLAGKRTMLP